MEKVPEQIAQQANKVISEGRCTACIDEMDCACFHAIADALMERDERAAKIVDDMGGLMGRTPAEAAAAIRSGQ